MKQKLLLLLVMTILITNLQAQKNDKASKTTTGYAITAVEKGGKSWREVRLVDVTNGSIVKSIYDSKQETEALNARTGKAVVKKDQPGNKIITSTFTNPSASKKTVNLDQELEKAGPFSTVYQFLGAQAGEAEIGQNLLLNTAKGKVIQRLS